MLRREGHDTVIAPGADAGTKSFWVVSADLAIVDIFLLGAR
jgi:hypothetical protein